jgi:trigger factor
MDYFSTNVVVKSIPDALNDYQTNIMLFFYQDYADRYGIELSELLASEGLDSTDDLIELYREYNTKNATYYLVIQAIAEDAGISVTDKDVTDYYIEIYGGADYSAQEEQFGLPYIKHSVLCLKVIDYIVENAVLL